MNRRLPVLLACLVVVAVAAPSGAADVDKKFRFGVTLGSYATEDTIRSPSANVLVIVDETDTPIRGYSDPRNDNAANTDLKLDPAWQITATGSYNFTPIFGVSFSAGYRVGDVGDIEVQAEFDGEPKPDPANEPFLFHIYGVKAGTIESIPLQVTAFARFRPQANLNPYVGLGVGYTLLGFDPSDEFNQLSQRLDNSVGGFARLTPNNGGLIKPGTTGDLTAAFVNARDTFEWHLQGGMEYGFRRNWSGVIEVMYTFASREFDIGFNGQPSLGTPVYEGRELAGSPADVQPYGAYYIASGGLVDGGGPAPAIGAPAGTVCNSPSDPNCVFDPSAPDGKLDTGMYYVHGGSIKYGGASLHVGLKYTF